MRHGKHKFQLGVKKEHRSALMANLASALFIHERIQTTLTKARALRPFAEKMITLAKKAASVQDGAKKLHYRRLAVARIRNQAAVRTLFDERAEEFAIRPGGYTRIYKLVSRIGDGSQMALIELVKADDAGYRKARNRRKGVGKDALKSAPVASEAAQTVASGEESGVS